MSSSQSNNPPLPTLSAPNRTFVSKQPPRRTSTFSTTSPVSPIASSLSPTSPLTRTPSNEVVEPFYPPGASSQLPIATAAANTIKQTIASTTSSFLRKPSESHLFSAAQSSALKTLSSAVSLSINDSSFWPALLQTTKFPSSHSLQDTYDLEMATVSLSIDLAANNVRTRNFNKLVLHLLSQLKHIQSTNPETIPTEAYNALFLTRVFTKHFAGNLTNEEIMKQFEDNVDVPQENTFQLDLKKLTISDQVKSDHRPRGEQLLDALTTALINLDPYENYSAYEFYTEILNTLIVFFSTQLHRSHVNEGNYFLDLLLDKFGDRADAVVAKLLENFITQKPPPALSSSVVYNAYSYLFSSRSGSASDVDPMPMNERSLLLLLLLTTQLKTSRDDSSAPTSPYRTVFANLRDHNVLATDVDGQDKKFHLISFKDLFSLFCNSLGVEERMLLLYVMLVENDSFRVYVLSRTDPETMYIPMLKIIYESVEGKTNYSQVYILLTIMLILSQDDVNNETIQKINVGNLTWFTERPLLKSISLGGLVMLVLIRTLQFNLSHQKDIYFHTNCLAILANMSSTVLDMHAYVAQRIISMFELISRRQQKLTTKLAHQEAVSMQDITVYEDMLSLVLEIINSILTHRLKNNTQLVYALLLKRDIFAPLRNHARLSELIRNIENTVDHFHARVSEANLKAPSTNEILDLIDQAARTWTSKSLDTMPDLKFQYEEEQDSREFFVPYVWALIHRRAFIYWTEEKAHILQEYRQMSGELEDIEMISERKEHLSRNG
ncbi:hypothetical protein O0I10_000582 [Lichtheimia ornata]|uniref:Dymeclin n=1 Tax=Lichtheimia ornata TaxID=688661 RepID=A0AAD7Y3X4_9FUNG|nr:uncharacterized protein O0I10_000582 [Lichtheimia ornata]KAJ8663343.1 hypothetical protein O0I10_000582 [Lichtheimia ornata]